MKKCCTCKQERADFNRNASTPDGLQNQCRECQREAKFKHRYGISSADVDRMMAEQRNRCAICGDHFATTKAVVDHDHSTGAVRGLLCHPCNVLLGQARDDEAILQAAIEYLRVKR